MSKQTAMTLPLVVFAGVGFWCAAERARGQDDTHRKQAEAASNLASELLAKKQVDAAIVELKKAIELDSKFFPAHFNLGIALRDKKEFVGSIAAFRKALELNPKFARTYNEMGIAMRLNKDPDGAIAQYRKAIEIAPTFAPAYHNLGPALVDKKDIEGAIAAYRKAIEIDPRNAQTHVNLGNALYRYLVPKDVDGAIAALRKAIELDAKHARAHFNLGIVYYEQNRFADAITPLKKGIELAPNEPIQLNLLGGCLEREKRLPEAIAAFQKAIQIAPNYFEPHHNLGLIYFGQKRFDLAEAASAQAIELNPKYAGAYVTLGNCLLARKRLKEAEAAFRKAIALNPTETVSHHNLGRVMNEQKRYDEAIAAYRKAIDLNPSYADAYLDMGNSLRTARKMPEAIAAYQKAVELNPKHEFAHYNIASALVYQHRFAEAEPELHKAVANNPKLPKAHVSLGKVHYWLGAFPQAAAANQQGIDLLPASDSLREWCEGRQKTLEQLQALDKRLPAVLEGKDHPNVTDLLTMARMCHRLKKHYRAAARLYEQAFKAQPALADHRHLFDAARAAALAATDPAAGGPPLTEPDKAAWRRKAHAWLEAALRPYAAGIKADLLESILQAAHALPLWREDSALAGIREPKELARLPESERKSCEKLWADVLQVLRDAAQRFPGARTNTLLSPSETTKVFLIELKAGTTYIFDLESAEFDTLLKLERNDQLLASSAPFDDDSLNSRIVFTATAADTYRLVVSSNWLDESGSYSLHVRELTPQKIEQKFPN